MPHEDPTSADSVLNRFTLIWHTEKPHERTWVERLFRPYIRQVLVESNLSDFLQGGVLDDCLVCDAFVQARDPARYSRFRGKNAFLIHFLDETYERHYDVYQNFKGVFRNFWSSVFNPDYVRALPLGPLAGVGLQQPPKAALQRRYVWSFVGQANKSTRVDVLRQLRRVEPHFVFATDAVPGIISGAAAISGTLPSNEYSEVLGDSMFAPSPMGNSNLECYRVYDALECGAIPIVERRSTLDYFRNLLGPHPLPTVKDWGEARELIARLLRSPESITVLQRECSSWWAAYQQKYTADIGPFLLARLTDSTTERPMYGPRANTLWWQIRELMRHHDASALRRRAQRQASRLLSGGGLRVAFRRGSPDR